LVHSQSDQIDDNFPEYMAFDDYRCECARGQCVRTSESNSRRGFERPSGRTSIHPSSAFYPWYGKPITLDSKQCELEASREVPEHKSTIQGRIVPYATIWPPFPGHRLSVLPSGCTNYKKPEASKPLEVQEKIYSKQLFLEDLRILGKIGGGLFIEAEPSRRLGGFNWMYSAISRLRAPQGETSKVTRMGTIGQTAVPEYRENELGVVESRGSRTLFSGVFRGGRA
jgi:hypothetical protein